MKITMDAEKSTTNTPDLYVSIIRSLRKERTHHRRKRKSTTSQHRTSTRTRGVGGARFLRGSWQRRKSNEELWRPRLGMPHSWSINESPNLCWPTFKEVRNTWEIQEYSPDQSLSKVQKGYLSESRFEALKRICCEQSVEQTLIRLCKYKTLS